jgi:hypothetical protein
MVEVCPLFSLVNYQSTTLFLLSHALPDLHDLATRSLFPNRRLRLIFPFWLWEFQLSTLSSSTGLPPDVDDLSMCVPHGSTVVIHFDSSNFRSLNSQSSLYPGALSFEDDDLLTCVLHRSMVVVHFASSGFWIFNSQSSLSPGVLSPEYDDLLMCVLLNRMTTIYFISSGF